MSQHSTVSDYINALLASSFGAQVSHHRIVPAVEAIYAAPKRPLSAAVQSLLAARNIPNLFSHQAHAIDVVRSGTSVVVSTPTASGKSLIYTLPVLESILQDSDARALYLFPLKALSQDQKKNFEHFVLPWPKEARPTIGIYDGDTSDHFRRKMRKNPPHILITTPEMLHLGIVAHHEQWSTFFAGLTHVVVDEAHTYRGVLGAHMAQLFQRIQRIAARYGAKPQFVLCTATVGNAQELGQNLLGQSHTPQVIATSGAPQGPRHFVFLNPHDSPATAAIGLLKAALARNLRTIVYCRSRRMTELISLWALGSRGTKTNQATSAQPHEPSGHISGHVSGGSPWQGKISAYRAGFLPEERRDIEQKMHSGELLAVISTSALELGIDIGSLDVCILVGYPGSIMATVQRGGRVGRAQQESAVVLVAGEDALDQYIVRHPQEFFTRPAEKAVINVHNPVILQKHLVCAAAELPLRPQDRDALWLGQAPVQEALQALTQDGQLLQSADGQEYLSPLKRPQRHVDLRGQDGGSGYTIEDNNGTIIGHVDALRALKETHPGALYLHRGQSYEITELDMGAKRIVAKPRHAAWFTRVRSQKHTDILEVKGQKTLFEHSGAQVYWGRLRITEHITGYEKRAVFGNTLLSIIPLDFPPSIFETEGLWICIPDVVRHALEESYMHFMGAIHALEHCAIGLLPLLVMADRNDFGGISTPLHAQLALPAVFIYDALPGGAGLCRQAYTDAHKLFQNALHAMQECPCSDGCPSCVHSPKCGSGNRPISKEGAIQLLQALTKLKVSENQKKELKIEFVTETESQCLSSPPQRYMVLDVETRRSAKEVGGWHKAALMGVSIAVLYDSKTNSFIHYRQEELSKLFALLQEASCVVGFNSARFDYTVLQPFCSYDLHSLPTLDLLDKVKSRLNYRISLDNIATATLHAAKSADGLQALQWWKEGKLDEIAKYCQKDVDITKQVYEFGLEHGYILFTNKAKQNVRCPVDFRFP